LGLGAAITGAWWTTVSMAFLVAALLASIVHEGREDAGRNRSWILCL
jgi:hypothetical protein